MFALSFSFIKLENNTNLETPPTNDPKSPEFYVSLSVEAFNRGDKNIKLSEKRAKVSWSGLKSRNQILNNDIIILYEYNEIYLTMSDTAQIILNDI